MLTLVRPLNHIECTMSTSRYSEPRYAKWTAPREVDVDAESYDGR